MKNQVWKVWILVAVLPGCHIFETIDPCANGNCEPALDASPSNSGLVTTTTSVASGTTSGPTGTVTAELDAGNDASASGSAATSSSAPEGTSSVTASAPSASAPDGGEPVPPCGGECASGYCNTATDECEQCLDTAIEAGDLGCDAAHPYCYKESEAAPSCVECVSDNDCDGTTPLCHTELHACVGCQVNEDCLDAAASKCDTVSNVCVPCAAATNDAQGINADCAHIEVGSVCHTGTCVECDATSDTCGNSVCNEVASSATYLQCQSDVAQRSASACDACVSDKQCKPGQGCVMTEFGNADDKHPVGYFCLYRKVAALPVPPNDKDEDGVLTCSQGARPYVSILDTATTIGGATGTYCGPRAATCLALKQYSSVLCGGTDGGGGDDGGVEEWVSECGATGLDGAELDDAVCQDREGVGTCSPRCITPDDCVFGNNVEFGCVNSVCSFELND